MNKKNYNRAVLYLAVVFWQSMKNNWWFQPCVKVRTFWETQKNSRNLPHALYIYLVNVKTMRKIFFQILYASQKVRTLHIRAGNTDQFTILGCCIIDGPLSNCINFLEIVFSGHENYAGIYLSFGPKCASNTYVPMFTLQIWLHGYAVQKPKAPLSAETLSSDEETEAKL